MGDNKISQRAEPIHEGFRRWAQLMIRFRYAVIMATAALVCVAGYFAATQTRLDTSVEAFAHAESETQFVLNEYRKTFGDDAIFLVLIKGDVFSIPYLTKLRDLHRSLEKLDIVLSTDGSEAVSPKTDTTPSTQAEDADAFGDFDGFGDDGSEDWDGETTTVVEEVTSILNVRETRRNQGGSLVVGELLDPFPVDGDLEQLKAKITNDQRLVGQVVDAAGEYSAISVRTQKLTDSDAQRLFNAIQNLGAQFSTPGFHVQVGGLPALNAELNRLLTSDLHSIFIWSVVVMFCVLLYLFRHPLGIFPPLFVVIASGLITVGTLAFIGMRLTMLSNILPAFLFCVGIGHSVHLISVYRDSMAEGRSAHDALAHALATTGVPIFFTSLTTMVGLLSFHFASLEAIQEMGYSGAFAVFLAFVLSVTFLPAALSFNRKGRFGRVELSQRDFLDRFLDFCLWSSGPDSRSAPAFTKAHRVRKRRNLTLMVVLVVAGVGGSLQLTVWHNPMSWMPKDVKIKQAFDSIDTHLGGTANIQILIDSAGPNGIKDKALLNGMAALQDHIKAYRDPIVGDIVGNGISIVDIVKETNRVMTEDRAIDYAIPETNRGVSDMLFLFENAGREQLERLVTADYTRTHMTIRMKWLEATAYFGLTKHISEGVATHIPENVEARPTGSVYTLVTTIGQMIHDLLASFGVAFVVITLIMMLLLRSIKLGLIAMVPNLMPIIMIMGIMGLSGIPIDMNTLLIASIAIGLAVDDTIHLLHHFRVNHQSSHDREAALRAAVSHSGRAMVSTTLILMLGFFTYLAADMTNVTRFGFLVGSTALLALLIDLFFAPALIRTFYPLSNDKTEIQNA
ncbi:MAG: efflux RND transporter permease subunit [Myxococcota bacterium]|nr:efflux RND transporter permease subunit [Myxococcota bacterium]